MEYSSYLDYAQYSDMYADQSAAYAMLDSINSIISGASLIMNLLMIIATWFLFEKAGENGWKSIVPIYGAYKQFEIVYGSGWKFLLLFVPILGSILSIAFYIRLAQAYGKGVLFGIGLLFFTPIFMLILAFGSARYHGPCYSFL